MPSEEQCTCENPEANCPVHINLIRISAQLQQHHRASDAKNRHSHILAINTYKAAHPDLDTSKTQFRLSRTEDGSCIVTGHEPRPDPDPLDYCCCHPWAPRHHGPLSRIIRFKAWFNRRWPYWRICMDRGCWRFQTNQYKCHLHQKAAEGQPGNDDFDETIPVWRLRWWTLQSYLFQLKCAIKRGLTIR